MDPIDYLVQVRAPLAELLYPNCRFLFPMTCAQMSRYINELWAEDVARINGMHLKEYGGALEYRLKKGYITAHSITGTQNPVMAWPGSRRKPKADELQDHILFEYHIPEESVLYQLEQTGQLVRPEQIHQLEKELYRELEREVFIRPHICQHTLYVWVTGLSFDQSADGRDHTSADIYRNADQVNKMFERVSHWLACFSFI